MLALDLALFGSHRFYMGNIYRKERLFRKGPKNPQIGVQRAVFLIINNFDFKQMLPMD